VVVEEDPDLMRTTGIPDALGMLVDTPSLVVTLMGIHDMPTRTQATSVRGVVRVAAPLARKTDRGISVLQRGNRMPRIRIAAWGPRQVMRSESRR